MVDKTELVPNLNQIQRRGCLIIVLSHVMSWPHIINPNFSSKMLGWWWWVMELIDSMLFVNFHFAPLFFRLKMKLYIILRIFRFYTLKFQNFNFISRNSILFASAAPPPIFSAKYHINLLCMFSLFNKMMPHHF